MAEGVKHFSKEDGDEHDHHHSFPLARSTFYYLDKLRKQLLSACKPRMGFVGRLAQFDQSFFARLSAEAGYLLPDERGHRDHKEELWQAPGNCSALPAVPPAQGGGFNSVGASALAALSGDHKRCGTALLTSILSQALGPTRPKADGPALGLSGSARAGLNASSGRSSDTYWFCLRLLIPASCIWFTNGAHSRRFAGGHSGWACIAVTGQPVSVMKNCSVCSELKLGAPA